MPKRAPKPEPQTKPPTPQPPASLFKTRLLGYLVGLLPIVGILLLLKHAVPQGVALGLMAGGLYFSTLVQQKAQKRFAYNFRDRGEWLALGVYAALVVVLIVVVQYL
jgi:hypothetical protein